jgi:hypothetical protein
LSNLVDKLDKDINHIEEVIKSDIEGAHLTYHNMDAKEKEMQGVREQLNRIDIPKDLVLPEFKLAFADIVDELDTLIKRKEQLFGLIQKKQDEVNKLRSDREQEIKDEEAAMKEVEALIAKEDFDEAERVLQRIVNHKMDEKLEKVQQIQKLRQQKEEIEKKKKEEEAEKLKKVEEAKR